MNVFKGVGENKVFNEFDGLYYKGIFGSERKWFGKAICD